MRLVSDPGGVGRLTGWDPLENLLAPRIHVDGPRMMTPLVVEDGDTRRLVVREQETGNLEALGRARVEVWYYEPYFTVGAIEAGHEVPQTITGVLRSLQCVSVAVGGDLPYARYLELAEAWSVDVARAGRSTEVTAYGLSAAAVLDRFGAWRRASHRAAIAIIDDGRPWLTGLKGSLTTDVDTRFRSLDRKIADADLDAVLLGSPVNRQELTGGAPNGEGWAALWSRDGDRAYLIGPREQPCSVPGVQAVGSFANLAAAVLNLAGPVRVGLEETWFGIDDVADLETAGVTVVPSTRLLARWREERDGEDLGSTVIVACASQHAIDTAITEAGSLLDHGKKPSERQIRRRYLQHATAFARRYKVEADLKEFFTNCHAGDRTIYPSLPTDYFLSGDTKTLKLDAGLRLSADGVTLATSDVGRTLTRTPEASTAYAEFARIIRDDVIGRLRPGVACATAHAWCVEGLQRLAPSLRAWQLLPDGARIRPGYDRRNVGHLMGKQESFVTDFRPESPFSIRPGDVGAAEIQWPYAGHGIAFEDMWIAQDEGAVNITRS